MKLSVVTTLYQSAPYINEFFERARKVAEEVSGECEFVFVNDGSPDESLDIVLQLQAHDDRITVVDLSRNFGHHRALMVGLEFSSGDLVFLIDVDLEEEPELLIPFFECIQDTNADSVYGVQSKRKGGIIERQSGEIFYRLLNFISGYDMPRNTLVARLMNRKFVDSLLLFKEREIDIAGLLYMTGFTQVPVFVKKHSKQDTAYTLPRKLALALRSMTAFSRRPLIIIFVVGLLILIVTGVASLYYFINFFASGRVPSGFTSIMISIWFLGGLGIFCTGLVALYISIIFTEVKTRPASIIKNIYKL